MLPLCPNVGPQDGRGYAAISDLTPLFGDPEKAGVIKIRLILSPCWEPQKGKGYVAMLPTCGPPRQQGLRSNL